MIADVLGNTGDDSVMHSTIGELASPILTAIAIPATIVIEDKTSLD